ARRSASGCPTRQTVLRSVSFGTATAPRTSSTFPAKSALVVGSSSVLSSTPDLAVQPASWATSWCIPKGLHVPVEGLAAWKHSLARKLFLKLPASRGGPLAGA